jgi:hypothetical protein
MGGGEVAVGPFLGELASLTEYDGHAGPADLEFGERVSVTTTARTQSSLNTCE